MGTTKVSTVLTERPDETIDARIAEYGDPNFRVVCSLFRYAPGASGGGTWPGIRANITCPLIQVKNIAQAASDLLVGGARIKVKVEIPDDVGNKHRILPEWFESFDGTPRVGAGYDGLTIAWDDAESSFVAMPRTGHTAPPSNAAYQPAPASIPAGQPFGGVFSDFPRPMRGPGGVLQPPPPTMVPGYLRHYPVEQQWEALAAEYARANGGRRPSLEPVDVAMQWKDAQGRETDRAQVQAARMEERYESVRDRAQQQLDAEKAARMALEKRLSDMETRHARELGEAQAKQREDALRAEIAAIRQAVSQPQHAPRSNMDALAPWAPVIGGVLTALVTSSADRAARQTEMMIALATKPAPEPRSMAAELTPILAAVSPIAGPLLLEWIRSTSPEKLAELADQKHMQGQAFVSMLMAFIEKQQPHDEPEPWWLGPLKSAVDSIVGGINRATMVAAVTPRLPPAQQQAELPRQPVNTIDLTKPKQPGVDHPSANRQPARDENAAPPAIATPTEDLEMFIGRLAEVDAQAASYTQAVMRMLAQGVATGEIDPRLVTQEWVSIVFEIHHKEPIRDLVPRIVDHLEHSRAFNRLPIQFGDVFTNPAAIHAFVSLLPMSSLDAPYTKALAEALAKEIAEREGERLRVEKEDASGEHEAVEGDEEKEEAEA